VTGRALTFSTFAVLAGGLPAHAVDFEKFKSTQYEVVEQSMTALLNNGFAIKALDKRDFILVNAEGRHVLCQLLAPLDPSLQDVFKGATAVSACYDLQ